MIRNLLATTAIATLIASGAYAQTTTAPAEAPAATDTQQAAPVERADGFLASNIIGESVYNGTGDEAQNIGDVNDIVIGSDGAVESVVIGVGGFLGIGEKNVALGYDKLDWAEENGDRWIVVAQTKEELETLPDFDTTPYEPAPAPVAVNDPAAPAGNTVANAPVTAPAASDAPAAEDKMASEEKAADGAAETETTASDAPAAEDKMASEEKAADGAAETDTTAQNDKADNPAATDATKTAAIDKSSLTEVPTGDIRAENLVGTTVYGANDANVGEIGDVILTEDGKVDSLIVDVGGFLGIGEKEVALGMDKLSFMTDKDGNQYLYTNLTKEQLDAAPAYDESSWAEKRDEQRIIVQ